MVVSTLVYTDVRVAAWAISDLKVDTVVDRAVTWELFE